MQRNLEITEFRRTSKDIHGLKCDHEKLEFQPVQKCYIKNVYHYRLFFMKYETVIQRYIFQYVTYKFDLRNTSAGIPAFKLQIIPILVVSNKS